MEISSTIILSDLSHVLLENLTNSVYNLTSEQQIVIESFIKKSPTILDKITKDIHEITVDGKINLQDIPTIIQLLTNTYHLYSLTDGLLQGDNIIVFIQYTINVIIDSRFILLSDFEKKKMDNLVNSCISLLRTNIIQVNENKTFFSKYFCCK